MLFNSLEKQQTKPFPPIRHICGTGFCAVAGEGELNRGGDLGTEADVFCLLENDWEQGDDLAFLMVTSAIFQ